MLHPFQSQRDPRFVQEVLDGLLEVLARRAADDVTAKLVSAWLTGACAVVSACLDRPGTLRDVWGSGRHEVTRSLVLEFTFAMMFRWFLHVDGAVSGAPADRLQTRRSWIRRVCIMFWLTDLEKRVAIRLRLNSLFNNDYEANLAAELSPSVIGLRAPNSLSPAEAAELLANNRRVDPIGSGLSTAAVDGGVSVLEPYWLGVRALGACGVLDRFRPRWDDVASMPVRMSAGLARGVPMRMWSLSAALLLAQQLDLGMAAMFEKLKDLPPGRLQRFSL